MFVTPQLTPAIASSLSSKNLNLILLPTEQCNFRCYYCYENFDHGRMHPDVIEGVKALISNRIGELDKLVISWFGGEPLLALPVIDEISSHIISSMNPSLQYTANITTNGYTLTSKTLAKLLSLGVNEYQISLDGFKDSHDSTRVTKHGRGSFDQIWQNLLGMRLFKEEFSVIIRIHYHLHNYISLHPLIEMINRQFSYDNRFHVYFKSVSRLGSKNDKHIHRFSAKEKQMIEASLYSLLANQKQCYNLSTSGEGYICYACKANSFVIRANGDVNKCTVALYNSENMVGKLLSNGEIVFDQSKLHKWIGALFSGDREKMACPYPNVIRK